LVAIGRRQHRLNFSFYCFSFSRPKVCAEVDNSDCAVNSIDQFVAFHISVLFYSTEPGVHCVRKQNTSYFETIEPIYVVFDTIQDGSVLNTSVKSLLNKFITQVAPPSDKMNNSGFHLQNQATLLHSNTSTSCTILALLNGMIL